MIMNAKKEFFLVWTENSLIKRNLYDTLVLQTKYLGREIVGLSREKNLFTKVGEAAI